MELITLITILLCGPVIFLLILDYYNHHNKKGCQINKIPGPKPLPILGNLLSVLSQPDGFWGFGKNITKKYGPVCKFWVFNQAIVYVSDPDDIKVVLSSTSNIDKSPEYHLLHPWLNTGLVTSTGKKWQQRRKIANTAFHYNVLQEYFHTIAVKTNNLVQVLRAEADTGEIIKELRPITSSVAVEIICETAMGTLVKDNNISLKKYYKAVHDFGKAFAYRLSRIWLYNDWIFSMTSKGHELSEVVEILHGFTKSIIEQRKKYHNETEGKYLSIENTQEDEEAVKSKRKKLALLDSLIAASKNNQAIDDDGIQEEVDTFVFAGHDTVSTALLCTIKLLAEHKDIQATAREEVNQVLTKTGGEITMAAVQQFCYLERCIKETLRFYPSVPVINRKITEDVQLKKYLIPAGLTLNIHIYNAHHDPNFWPDPEVFDPDRFLPENSIGRHSHAYVPFSAGPRNCIGQKFAMIELKTVVAGLLHNFYFEPTDVKGTDDNQLTQEIILKWTKPVYTKFIPILK
ncbi:cytochrome P450 4C1-like [Aphidius gifuensis]|uniref:cytochrome P450 4C1-like n=1 Tax=Aphidius gifuensis TaxID=684658 RepID=UPI001CDC2D44|nr:cytochrome P450 4C1-like [Aphidius gifuensis]